MIDYTIMLFIVSGNHHGENLRWNQRVTSRSRGSFKKTTTNVFQQALRCRGVEKLVPRPSLEGVGKLLRVHKTFYLLLSYDL